MPQRRDEIAEALRQRVMAGLHLGVIRQGDRLPSVRRLSAEFDADPRVILAAYRQLELEGLVEVRPRSGNYVAETAVSAGEMLPQVADWVVDVLVQALARGIPAVEFSERVRRCMQTVRMRVACIECNFDQITGLCNELSRDYGLETTGVEIDAMVADDVPAAVHNADLLVTTSYHARELQRIAKRLDKPCIVISLREDFLTEIQRYLEHGPVYFVATDPRFTDKLRRMVAATAWAGNLRPMIVGRDELSQIPAGAPTYVMQAAQAELDDVSGLVRLIPAPRVFSPDSARAILSFLIRSNIAAIALQERESTTAS